MVLPGKPETKRKAWGCGAFAIILFASLVVISNIKDPPKIYSDATIETLKSRIREHEAEIAESGSLAAALDADRYWPYDRDRTALALFLYRNDFGRWPQSWKELRNSGHLEDPGSIHGNWNLVVTNDGWEIRLNDSRTIALYRAKGTRTPHWALLLPKESCREHIGTMTVELT